MIKEVFNSITRGVESAKSPVSGGLSGNQSGETQGFFGKMFLALQQEGQEGNEQNLSTSGEPETKEGREAVKQALQNLMQDNEPVSAKNLIKGETKVGSEPSAEADVELAEENSNLRLVVQPANAENSSSTSENEKANSENNLVAEIATNVEGADQESAKKQIVNTTVAEAVTQSGNATAKPSEETLKAQVQGAKEITTGANTEKIQGNIVAETKMKQALEATVDSGLYTSNDKGSETASPANTANADKLNNLQGEGQQATTTAAGGEVNTEGKGSREPIHTTFKNTMSESPKVAESAPKQVYSNESAPRNERIAQNVQTASQQQVLKNEVTGQLHVQNEVKAQQASEERSKRYDFVTQNADGKSINGDRLEVAAASGSSGGNQQSSAFSDIPNWLKFQAANQQKAGELNTQQQAFLDEHLKEVTEQPDDMSSDSTKNGMNRLGEFPVQNAFIRRSVLPGLTSIMQKASSSGKEISQNWQKHSFELDDGNKIELSTRNSDGVIQLKIASSNQELTKLLQQYGQEIKEHLEKECELNIDLQFSDEQEEGLSGFFSDSSSSDKQSGAGISVSGGSAGESPNTKEPLQQSVRRFGYNQMEWTA